MDSLGLSTFGLLAYALFFGMVVRWAIIWTRHKMIGPFWLIEWTKQRRSVMARTGMEMLVAFGILIILGLNGLLGMGTR